MQSVVVVPGIFGTRMVRADGVELWPPLGQGGSMDVESRAHGIVDATTTPGAIIEDVVAGPLLELPTYSPLISMLELLPATRVVRFPYDWRVDLRDAARALARLLTTIDGPIVLVGHSMGGLVCRTMLESPEFAHAPWLPRVRQLVCIATPHLGAPLAVFRLLGFEGLTPNFLFPGRAMLILAGKPAQFPAGHQLLPPKRVQCVGLPGGGTDFIEAQIGGIDPGAVDAKEAVHTLLASFRRPPATVYRFIYGHRLGGARPTTTVGIDLDAQRMMRHRFGDGDGTVPAWSGRPETPPGFLDAEFAIVGEHVAMLADPALHDQLERWVSPLIA